MNWYLKLSQTKIATYHGGKLENWASTLAGMILQSIKAGEREDEWDGLERFVNVQQNDPMRDILFDTILTLNVIQKKPTSGRRIDCAGRYTITEGVNRIKVQVQTTKLPIPTQWYEELLIRLKETIRHELEHFDQTKGDAKQLRTLIDQHEYRKPGDMVGGNWADKLVRYYTNPMEVPAFVSAAYLKAKKMRIPIDVALEENLALIQHNLTNSTVPANLIPNAIAQIRVNWMEYARQRYPNSPTESTN
jgi:hypothetical protein